MTKEYISRYLVEFEEMELAGDTAVKVKVLIKGNVKELRSSSPQLIQKLKEWNLGKGVMVRLYYTSAELWDLEKPDMNTAIDKNFKVED